MLSAEELKDIFESEYHPENWRRVLIEVFGIKNFHIKPQTIGTVPNDWEAKGYELGSFASIEGRLVGVYEVQINDSVKLQYNKVGLRNLLKPIYNEAVDAALVVFNQGKRWRFSYVSEIRVTNKETGKREKKITDPKRYTYLFGEGQKCRTPAERFAKIQQQYNLFGGGVKLEEIEKAFSVDSLTKDFYKELSDWYFRALKEVHYPDDAERSVNSKQKKDELEKEEQTRNATNTIRLITRLIFVWFLKQKGLVPDELFVKEEVDKLINYKDKGESTYYKAILQNLFFATLNTQMGDDNRKFVDRQYGIQGYYRYKRFFKDTNKFLNLTKNIPFLNGGLFENLDKNVGKENEIRIDCFSNALKNETRLVVPDSLFFREEVVDLSDEYHDKKKKSQKVRGLINILQSYNFTIEENTPFEIEVALDPELLGKVFENLLASYVPETESTARKLTGSFYTPREIVDYMVDESLKSYLSNHLPEHSEEKLNHLFSYTTEAPFFNNDEKQKLIHALDKAKILDPACGSGAFPMGVLLKMVFLLNKLDAENEVWKDLQEKKAIKETEEAYKSGNKEERDLRLLDISEAFEDNSSDYGRKLYLIENCIYGVDIQPIAVQISKLRFFISLICDQEVNNKKKNYGVRPLPNLETKFVAANTLIGLNKPKQLFIRNLEIEKLEKDLNVVRHMHFSAPTPAKKEHWRKRDSELRGQISELLKEDGWDKFTAEKIAQWNPYDQNASASFYDNEWMFGITAGFDVVLGNPPYGVEFTDIEKEYLKKRFKDLVQRIRNSYLYFMGIANECLSPGGVFSFIIPNEFLFQIYMEKARRYFLSDATIKTAINLGEDVFDAIVPSCVVVIKKSKKKSYNVKLRDLRKTQLERITEALSEDLYFKKPNQEILESPNSTFSFNKENGELVNRIMKLGVPFEEYCEDVSNGISTSCDEVYIVNKKKKADLNLENAYLKPTIRGSQFNKFYCPEETGDSVLYIKTDFDEAKAPNTFTYLSANKELLIRKSVEKKNGLREWYLLFRSRNEDIFSIPKIIIRQTADRLIAAVDDKTGYYCIDSVNLVKLKVNFQNDILFFVSLLNSQLFKFVYQEISQESGRVLAQVKPQRIRQMPIIEISSESKRILKYLAEYITELKKLGDADNDIAKFYENLLDAVIYELYFPEQIRIANCEILMHLHDLKEINEYAGEEIKLDTINKEYARLSNSSRQVRVAMFNMDTIEEIAIIEGKKK